MDLPGLTAAATSSKQQQAASSTREMGKNQTSVVVLHILLKFWWMIPSGMRDTHTKFERETQWWRPGMGVAGGRPQFQKLQFRAKSSHFGPKEAQNPFKTAKERERVGALHVRPDVLVSTSHLRPSDSTICLRNGPKRHPQAPNFVQIGWRQPQTKNRPYLWLHGSKRDSEGT